VATPAATRRTHDPTPHGQATTPAPTREIILDAAERLFSARGVDGVAVRDLAAEMGITASSLYNHFVSKQALYDAVVERGVGPIVELVGQAWQPGALRPGGIQATLDRLTAHLARHPHLARLLQRALLEDSGPLQALIERWITLLYREGITVIRPAARDAGWQPAEVPHLGIALYGMIFAYFTNPAALRRLAGWTDDPLAPRALAAQRRFLEQAIYRLLGPRPRSTIPRRKTRASSKGGARRRHLNG
jgi:TetR/AcrR family transcriptional regulator